jgi:hypothetical protein
MKMQGRLLHEPGSTAGMAQAAELPISPAEA